ncbi:hypothetical protein CWB99_11340 [Pseudoalteromonas rubra]|uniref:Uncharacterized protein n=1 Tax=Pseudoalteromonas rubra TaxID=43658 RepID=A0A5S3WME2_9GAMM|nr:hypothetical protein [Pseudoalteromonas rubra]TMP28500.1 hypothetical protein CWB99_11340 [Pseudoalteromonas rubra]TMP30467.1 hypothetical protein CWC00_16460 [Pseudoalteromonas rubra]
MWKTLFAKSPHYDGIRPFNIYFMRLIYILMVFVLGQDVWGHIFTYEGAWEENEAMAWSVWAAFSVLAVVGVFRPVQMIPVLLLEIIYKLIWLVLVAYPLWQADRLVGSGLEETTFAFVLVILPILAMPWHYVFNRYIYTTKETQPSPG